MISPGHSFKYPFINFIPYKYFLMRTAQHQCGSPQKSPSPFQISPDSAAKPPVLDSPARFRTNHTSAAHSLSPERRGSIRETANYVSPFSPYLESKSSLDDSQSLTDRYIPSRKLLKKQSFYQEEESFENNQNEVRREDRNFSVSDVYKKYIMTREPSEEPQRGFEVFQNNNLLKYTSRSVLADSSIYTVPKNNRLEFAEQLVSTTSKKRKINKAPCKVLDAPALQDDYYLNLMDWSTQNLLAVGLANSVYLWNSANAKVTKLCELNNNLTVSSVAWSVKDPFFSLGTSGGEVQIWDVNKMKRIRTLNGHSKRVGAMAWNSTIMSTGSRDKTILQRDIRSSQNYTCKLLGHRQEVCGLKWSFDEQQLCSGGNDNKLLIWNNHTQEPVLKFCDHLAAVKAMAWSPHQHGLLVSGGGSADQTIKFRNTLTGHTLKSIEVGSQVCNLMFSKTVNEIVSTHGFSLNQINIWKYPKMEKIATLTGHTFRVLYLAMSPDGSTIVTGAGDETLRFWNVFPNRNQSGKKIPSLLHVENAMIR